MTDWYRIVKLINSLESEAELRGDDRASGMLREVGAEVFAVQADLLALEKRRATEAAKKRRQRENVTGTNRDGTGQTGTPGESPLPPYVSPHTLSKTQHDAPAREALVDVERIERLTGTLSRTMGELWPDADAFLKRREYRTWAGWLPEMLLLIGPGSQFVAADLAQVCRDDAALDRPIGSPKGLRIFLGSARNERLNPGPPSSRPRSPESVDAQLDRWAATPENQERKRA